MKNIIGLFLTSFLLLFFGITTYAEPTSKISQSEDRDIILNNVDLVESITDEKTGVQIEVYSANESTSKFAPSSKNISPLSGNGKWDVLGGEVWVMNGDPSDWRKDGTYYSTGGDYALVIPPHEMDELKVGSEPATTIKLYEYDPQNRDDYVASYITSVMYRPNFYIVFRNIDKYVDGANSKAEFYTKHRTNYTVRNQALYVQYFD
ncbi:hypothetical protein [Paraliobacillus ryukyuensis]|uniref:hypothetical protein n=1 Tax=Paraliobacillus ryukyuensis TaxID=200904 RepID=UPI0009A5C8DD|nr:hypothetical protein [Paraliobacillus ryukyuensis]